MDNRRHAGSARLLVVLLALSLGSGCAGQQGADSTAAPQLSGVAGLDASMPVTARALPGIIAASTPELRVSSQASDGTVSITLQAAALRQAKAIYAELRYDPQRYQLLDWRTCDALSANPAWITLALQPEAGRAVFGAVLRNYPSRPGLDGSLELAVLCLRPGADTARSAAIAPSSNGSRTPLSHTLTDEFLFYLYNQGDYDQNGEVNISDLTPLGANFGASSVGGAFPPTTALSVIDGDGNGVLNISDLTPLGANYGRRVAGYNIYTSGSLDSYPSSNDGPNGAGATLLDTTVLADAVGAPAADRLRFIQPYGAWNPAAYYWVRPFDGASEGTPSLPLRGFGDNTPPLAALSADVESGAAPLLVHFDASGSVDFDGTIVKFEWNFDGDGDFELDTADVSASSHTYDTAGSYHAQVRVTDDIGLTDIATVTIDVTGGGGPNDPPVASLSSTSNGWTSAVTINFDARASHDPDGSIVQYQWDFEGDGAFEAFSGASPFATHAFSTPGDFNATVRVVDNQGATTTAAVTIHMTCPAPPSIPPLAVLLATPDSGDPPLLVHFDAQGSSDPDGSIVEYDFDFDGDGTFSHSSTTGTYDFTYDFPGLYNATVQVKDNSGSVQVDSVVINVNGPRWHVAIVDSGGDVGQYCTLVPTTGAPSIAYYDRTNGDLKFCRALDAAGLTWDAPQTLDSAGDVGA